MIEKATTIIDLSLPLKQGLPLRRPPQITYYGHEETAAAAGPLWGLRPEDFPNARYGAWEEVTLTTHVGTHLDAPWHFGPTSEGKPSRTIDQIPLEWCYGDGVILDFSSKGRGDSIADTDVQAALVRIDYQLKAGDIVLIRTDTSNKYYSQPGYEDKNPGMTRQATLWLIEQGIKVMGIDAWGWDRPHDIMAAELKSGIKGSFWAAHYVGQEKEYCHIEGLTNLDKIPKPFGFKVAAFPIKIEGASAGWVRAVAIIER